MFIKYIGTLALLTIILQLAFKVLGYLNALILSISSHGFEKRPPALPTYVFQSLTTLWYSGMVAYVSSTFAGRSGGYLAVLYWVAGFLATFLAVSSNYSSIRKHLAVLSGGLVDSEGETLRSAGCFSAVLGLLAYPVQCYWTPAATFVPGTTWAYALLMSWSDFVFDSWIGYLALVLVILFFMISVGPMLVLAVVGLISAFFHRKSESA